MNDLRTAAQQALEALECVNLGSLDFDSGSGRYSVARSDGPQVKSAIAALRAALAEPTVKESLRVPAEVAATLTTTDIAWLETRRMTKLWQELGQMRWAGADEGWDRAIEAVRSRLNDECQAVLDWKAMADQSQATAVQLLRKMQGVKDD